MPPQRAVTRPAGLQLHRRKPRRIQSGGIAFAGRRSFGIKLLQVIHADGRFLRIRRAIRGIEIGQIGIADRKLGNELAHLQSPIAEMHVADDFPAIGAKQPLQAIADDRGAQMPDMHRLRDIWSTEIEHRGFSAAALRQRGFRRCRQPLQSFLQNAILQAEIDKARTCDRSFFEQSGFA